MSPFIVTILKGCFGSYIAQVREKSSWHQCGWTDSSMLIAPALHYIANASNILVENFSYISIFVRMSNSLNGQIA